jgi:kanamycin nucleotidyltransferase
VHNGPGPLAIEESAMIPQPVDRLALARALCARLVAANGDGLLVGGVYGSVARGEDTPWSDLELLFVTRDGHAFPGRHLLYCGGAVGYEVLEEGALVAALERPTTGWPMRMGVLSVLRVLHGDPALVARWLDVGRAVPRDAFRAALAEAAPGLVVESYGRMHSCVARGDLDVLHVSALEVLLEMNTALCLLNGCWVTHDYVGGIIEAAAFPLVPEGYDRLAPALWRERDPAMALALADALVDAYHLLLDREGIAIRDAQSLEELAL